MCIAWEGIGSLGACVSISRAAALIDEAIEAGEFATNQQCCYEGWLASLPCLDPYYVSTALPRDRVFTAMPDLCGQRTAGKCFHSDHSASLVSEKDFLQLAHTCGRTYIYNPYQQCITLLSPTSFKSRNSSTQAHTHTHSQPPPAANKNMKNEDSEMELPTMAQGEFG